jgi:hypothetical protein
MMAFAALVLNPGKAKALRWQKCFEKQALNLSSSSSPSFPSRKSTTYKLHMHEQEGI